MTWVFSQAKIVRAYTVHACDHCGTAIDKGTRYRRASGLLDGAKATLAEHTLCRAAWEGLNFDVRRRNPTDGAPLLAEDTITPDETGWMLLRYPVVAARLGLMP